MSRNVDPRSVAQRLGSKEAVRAGRRARKQAQRGRSATDAQASAGSRPPRRSADSKRPRRPVKQPVSKRPAPKVRTSRSRKSGPNRLARAWSAVKSAFAVRWLGVWPPLFPGRKRTRRAAVKRGRPERPERAPARFALGSAAQRQRAIEWALLAAALVLAGRAAQLQLVDGDRYGVASAKQTSVQHHVRGKRGSILDRRHQALAVTVDVDSVFAEPRRLEDPVGAARALAPLLEIPETKLLPKLRSDRAFVYLARRVDPALGAQVRRLRIAGIGTHPEAKRYYANTDLAAHVMGFVNIDGEGRSGVERTFDPILRGGSLSISAIRDGLGNRALTDGYVPPAELAGRDLVLTLDRVVQDAADDALAEAVREHRAKAGAAIVMEVPSGDLLALSSYPAFNPNNLAATGPAQQLNRAISAVYEPGSTMKVVTLAAALEAGLYGPDDELDCENGKWRFGGRTIHDGNHEFGTLSLTDVLRVSSNICSAKVGIRLGRERMHDWIQRFGLARPTGVELPGELDGLLRPPSKWSDIGLANIAFGQGLAVTPLQLVQAMGAIANDGEMVAPRVVRGVVEEGKLRPIQRPEPRRVVSARTARTMRKMMETVVESGTAKRAAVPGVRVAGKTGTSQKVDRQTRRYSRDRYVASFVGMAPAEAPQLVTMVLLDEPRKGHHGGIVTAAAFRRIMETALGARGRPVIPEAWADAEPLPPAPVRPAPTPERSDEPILSEALSPQARELLGLEVPTRRPRGEPDSMPDLAGLELREVLRLCGEARCAPVVLGSGRVVAQSPPVGARVPPGSRWRLTLAPR